MSGGFTKIKLAPIRMVGIPANPLNPTHVTNVKNPITEKIPTSAKQALEFIAAWNEHQTMYTYQLLEMPDALWFPKRESKYQTIFELETEE